MSGECDECGEHTVDCVCGIDGLTTISPLPEGLAESIVKNSMKAVPVRYCKECGKVHNSGIEDRMEGTFEPIDTCIDCLMGKCSFNFEKTQVTFDDLESKTYDEMQKELG